MLITNDNVPLNLVEEATVLYRLQKYGLTPKEISTRTGRKPATISTLLKLNEAPEKIKQLISEKTVTPTLVMEIFRTEKDFDAALTVIECTIESAGKNTLFDKESKITKKDVDKAQGKTNSYSAVKKALRIAEKKELVVKEDKKEIYKFVMKLNSGKYTLDALLKELFEKEEKTEK
jgi:hypothetical protein